MPKFFDKDGRIFMEVTPVKSLLRSSMVTDVVETGGKFVVDMNNGDLTIVRPVRLTQEDPRPRYKPTGKDTIVISCDFDMARQQLISIFNRGDVYGTFYYGTSKNRRSTRSKGSFQSFILKVEELYRHD
jgi:hypothetical protein